VDGADQQWAANTLMECISGWSIEKGNSSGDATHAFLKEVLPRREISAIGRKKVYIVDVICG
jgi:hypothetical protein